MWLNLGDGGINYQTHSVVHNFGQALGLKHQHQCSYFWDHIEKYLIVTWIKKHPDYMRDATDTDSATVNKETYDPKSVMHYP